MRDFIERLKAKPEHVRRRIALGTSLGVTGVVAGVWFVALLFSGTLSFSGISNGTASGALAQSGTSGMASLAQTNFGQLLGAVGVSVAPQAPAALTPIDTSGNAITPSESVPATSSQPTVIPF